MHPDDVAIGAVELGIDIDESLHIIVAGRDPGKAGYRRAKIGGVNDGGLARDQPIDVAPEERCSRAPDLEARLRIILAAIIRYTRPVIGPLCAAAGKEISNRVSPATQQERLLAKRRAGRCCP